MGRGGARKSREGGPERKCAVTGELRPKSELVRFVAGPDGRLAPDILGKLPGRGVHVTADREALALAVKRGVFARGLKTDVAAPGDLPQLVERLLVRRVIELVSLARKSGQAVTGYEKVRSWLESGRASVLVQASDGSGRGKAKLNTPYRGRYVGCLTAKELGLAFGRDEAIHAALATGGLGVHVVREADRLRGLRAFGDEKPCQKARKDESPQ